MLYYIAFVLNAVALPYFVWLFTVTSAAYLSRFLRKDSVEQSPSSRFLIVIPAHDEALGVRGTIESCLELNYPSHLYETLVLADNCGDSTAEIARQSGATVVERSDVTKKSKGYALENLFDLLQRTGRFDSFDAIVVIDADTTVDSQLLIAFAKSIEGGADWAQAFNTVRNREDSWRTCLMTYAFCFINGTFLLGQNTLGLSASLRGNGMCLSTRGLRRIPWSANGLAEDEEFSWKLRLEGETIAFEPQAVVYAAMLKEGGTAAAAQRRRWEFGRREARRKTLYRLIRSTTLSTLAKAALLLELTIPTMVNLILLYAGIAVIINGYCLSNGAESFRTYFISSSVLMTLSLGLYALSPFLVFRLPLKFGISLAYVPIYAIWKFAVLLQGRPKEWVRARRTHFPPQIVSEHLPPGSSLHPGCSISLETIGFGGSSSSSNP